ncbi:MAG: alpha/beta hydrolase [Bacteroidetes bacterium]|nr:alpha/beta hydrolase [Bacteroidota bacterium]
MKTIILHGALANKSQFDELIHQLNLDVISIDLPGHGEHKVSDGNEMLAPAMVDYIKNMIEENGWESVNVIGYSMGGYVALKLAIDYPHLVMKIVTLGTIIHWDDEIVAKESKFLNPSLLLEKNPAFAASLKLKHQLDWEVLLLNTAKMLADIGAHNYLNPDELHKIKHQVLMLIGEQDSSAKVDSTTIAASHIKGSVLKVIPNTPHAFEKNDLSLLANIVNNFLNDES